MLHPTNDEIREVFDDEVTAAGGHVKESIEHQSRLFMRAVLTERGEARPKDFMLAGVAFRATEQEISIHPYTFRLACKNGAILARTLGSMAIERPTAAIGQEQVSALLVDVRCSIRQAADPSTFEKTMALVRHATGRSGTEAAMDVLLAAMPLLVNQPRERRFLQLLLTGFLRGEDRTLFELGNAITSVAREQKDPGLKWRLEELGGGVLVGALPTLPDGPTSALARIGTGGRQFEQGGQGSPATLIR